MFVGILIVLILIALGVLNARAFVSSKHEKAKDCIDKIAPYEGYIGLAGIAFGVVGLINTISYISHLGLHGVIGLIGALLCISLGILSSAALIRQQVPNLAPQVDKALAKLLPLQTNLGLAGIGLGIFYLLLILF